MDLPSIGRLHEDEYQALRNLIHCVLSHEGDYYITDRIESSTRTSFTVKPSTANPKHSYSVVFLDGTEPPLSQPIVCRSNLDRRLSGIGYTEGCFEIGSDIFRFTQSGLSALREEFPPNNIEVMRYIGHALFLAWQEHPRALKSSFHLDVEPFCDRRGIKQKQFAVQSNLMVQLGLARFSGHAENHVHDGYVWLTPEGLDWASRGFPDRVGSEAPTTNVNVEVQVLTQFIHQVEELPISEDDKARFERILRRFEEESGKEEPSYKPLQDGLDMLTKVKELWPVGFRFFSQNLDTIERMARHIPGV